MALKKERPADSRVSPFFLALAGIIKYREAGMKGDLIRFLRQSRKLSQWRLAKKLGWSQSKVSMIESGIRDLKPSEEALLLSALQKRSDD